MSKHVHLIGKEEFVDRVSNAVFGSELRVDDDAGTFIFTDNNDDDVYFSPSMDDMTVEEILEFGRLVTSGFHEKTGRPKIVNGKDLTAEEFLEKIAGLDEGNGVLLSIYGQGYYELCVYSEHGPGKDGIYRSPVIHEMTSVKPEEFIRLVEEALNKKIQERKVKWTGTS